MYFFHFSLYFLTRYVFRTLQRESESAMLTQKIALYDDLEKFL